MVMILHDFLLCIFFFSMFVTETLLYKVMFRGRMGMLVCVFLRVFVRWSFDGVVRVCVWQLARRVWLFKDFLRGLVLTRIS